MLIVCAPWRWWRYLLTRKHSRYFRPNRCCRAEQLRSRSTPSWPVSARNQITWLTIFPVPLLLSRRHHVAQLPHQLWRSRQFPVSVYIMWIMFWIVYNKLCTYMRVQGNDCSAATHANVWRFGHRKKADNAKSVKPLRSKEHVRMLLWKFAVLNRPVSRLPIKVLVISVKIFYGYALCLNTLDKAT